MGINVIGSDSDGFVLGGCMRYKFETACVDWVELEAIRIGLVWTANNNFVRIILESNCAGLVNQINSHREDITLVGHHVEEIRSLLKNFLDVDIRWIHRDCNKVVNKLSSLAIDSCCNSDFDMDYQKGSYCLVISDSV